MSTPDDTPHLLWLQFLNGTYYGAENVQFTFSMEESPEGKHIANFVFAFGDFYDEVSLPVTVSDGRVFIDSTPTLFVVDPDSLIDDNTIQLFQTENLTLSGVVLHDSQPTTLIEDYHVVSKVVDAYYNQTGDDDDDVGMFALPPLLWFDSKTGVLTRASVQFSDVLLNKLGVSFITGHYELVDYSENLNFTLVRMSPSLWELIILPVFIIGFVLVVFFAYRASKKKKRDKRKTYSNKSLKFYILSNIQRCWCTYGS
ncbi:MAG: hypothetical protein FWB84_05790 [Candidatus Bathyarchaeota archaeon]|uniref:hypothetical protein n=1 Tax=Candidatus Bathycorpusculum sp. TaxID=2994959 RepID=UPI00281BE25E|nr:hypothetical protein [Candidatus Termiticorpusculum sp.]MCL2291862.1 hypothetical protein [Candidatus Termiticorpusculum sp.]